jgi:hypothetical protein
LDLFPIHRKPLYHAWNLLKMVSVVSPWWFPNLAVQKFSERRGSIKAQKFDSGVASSSLTRYLGADEDKDDQVNVDRRRLCA